MEHDAHCMMIKRFLKCAYHVSKVGEQMHVGLRATTSTLHTEAALLSKFQQK